MNDAARDNKYQYNGKEIQDDWSLNWYAYGARYYDAALGRFTGVDPIADRFPHVTTYNYAENMPVNGIDLYGLQWVHFSEANKIKVNVRVSYEGSSVSHLQLNTYLEAAQSQFKRTINQSSGGLYSGELSFNENLGLGGQFIPNAGISEFSNATGVAGLSGMGTFVMSIFDTQGNLQTAENFGLDFVHELLHTIRLDHPFELTQAKDTELLRVGPNSFETTNNTDPNISQNIMNYGMIKINGQQLSDIWKTSPGDQLTMGQMLFMLKEIEKQRKGEGGQNDPNFNYWIDYPGEKVRNKN